MHSVRLWLWAVWGRHSTRCKQASLPTNQTTHALDCAGNPTLLNCRRCGTRSPAPCTATSQMLNRNTCMLCSGPQAVRDEILNIMHRNKIKEVKGTWMEEWHQKLHNVSGGCCSAGGAGGRCGGAALHACTCLVASGAHPAPPALSQVHTATACRAPSPLPHTSAGNAPPPPCLQTHTAHVAAEHHPR